MIDSKSFFQQPYDVVQIVSLPKHRRSPQITAEHRRLTLEQWAQKLLTSSDRKSVTVYATADHIGSRRAS